MHRELRLSLAVVFVKPSDDKITLLECLRAWGRAVGLRICCRLADKGCCAIPVGRWLPAQPVSAIRAAPIRGKQGETRALCQGPTSDQPQHTFCSAEQGAVTVPVAVVRTYQRQRSGRRRVTWLVYVCLGVGDAPPRIRKRYRRFGIESSYRLMEQVRGRTTSPNAALRFVLMGLALLIVNVWIWLHWQFLWVPGRGPRLVARSAFRLERMVRFLTRAIERYYGVVTAVDPPVP